MPELPEVELITRSLNHLIKGRKIISAELLREKLAPFNTPLEFRKQLKNSKINFVHRRGKHILFDLDSNKTLITHLRMTGRFMLFPYEKDAPKHTHAAFYFEDETKLVFEDQRHFGLMKLVKTPELLETNELRDLAPEPFSDEFTVEYLAGVMKKSNRGLKEFLLDQTKVCGLGNIYVSESLFISGINPRIKANRLSLARTAKLYDAIKMVLAESISHGSTLNVDPENIEGNYYGGAYEGHWRVYDQEGEACMNCREDIKRIVQGGRSTYYCPRCQR